MSDGGTLDRPCADCGASIPGGRSVCPSCGTLQSTGAARATAATPVAPAPATPASPPPGFAKQTAPATWAPVPPPPAAPKRTRSWGPLVAIVVVIALVAGGAYVWTQRNDSSSDTAAKAGATTTTAAAKATTTTTPITWTTVTDPASGLSWKLPVAKVMSLPSDLPAGMSGPFTANPTTWLAQTQDGSAIDAQINIWAPSMGAGPATIDELLTWNHDMYRRANTPYPKALTVAGQPATVVDASSSTGPMLQAVATVDGALVSIVATGSKGAEPDPALFEQIVASFSKT